MNSPPKTSQAPRSLTATLTLALLALSVTVLLLSSGLQVFFSVRTQQAIIAHQQQAIAREASEAVGSFIQEKFSVLATSARLLEAAAASPDERQQVLAALLGLQPAFRQLVLMDVEGQTWAKASRLSQTASGQLGDQLKGAVQTRIRQHKKYVGPVHIDPVTYEPLVLIAVAVTGVYGDFQGVLAAEVNLKFIWDLVDQLKVGETGLAYVVDGRGNLIAFRDIGRVLKGENVERLEMVHAFTRHPSAALATGTRLYSGITGATVVGTYVSLGTPDWAVVTEMPWAEAYQEVIRNAVIALVVTMVMVVCAGFIGAFLARRLAVPLINLTTTATRIADGEIELQAAVDGPKETVRLATAFNSMTHRLRQTLDGLEQRVTDRTAELAAANQALRKSEDLLNAVGAMASVGGWELDVATQEVRWTRETYRIHDIPEGGTFRLAQAILFYDMPGRSTLEAALQHAMEKGDPFDLELPFTSATGRHLWTRVVGRAETANGVIVRLTGTFQDITIIKRTEEERRASQEKFQRIVDNVGIGVALISPSLEILELNRQMRAWFPSVTPGSSILCYAHFNEPPRTEPCTYCPALKTFQDGQVHEAFTETPAGDRMRHFRIVSSPILDSAGRVVAAIEMVEDVTERMEAETQLRQQQKLTSISTLARGMAHEINNPLNGIMNYAELIKDQAPENAPLVEFADEIIKEGQRVATMTHSLLSFTQQDAQSFAPTSPAAMVAFVLPPAQEAARAGGVLLTCVIPPDLPMVSCRQSQIGNVIMALFANAMEAWDEETLGTGHSGGANKAIHWTARRLDKGGRAWVRLTVSDNGPGIPEQIRERVFDPFFTTKDRTQHSGLGLWIGRSIIQEHGGEITVESEAGKGTQVHLDLPLG